MNPSPELIQLVSQYSGRPLPDGMEVVGRALQQQYSQAMTGILFYGSCLRTGSDRESLVDCYVLVKDYFSAYSSKWLACANWILPPNVFYLNVPLSDRVIRVKYAVLSVPDFQRSVTSRWFHSYFWARFAQPVVFLGEPAPEVKRLICRGLAQAVCTFLEHALPRMTGWFTAEQLWKTGLMLTYGAELRAEPKDRAHTLWLHDQEHYARLTTAQCTHNSSVTIRLSDGQTRYRATYSRSQRAMNRLGWRIRTFQGKLLSIFRLIKAAFTFAGGADYLMWKIERHSGVKIDLTPAQRRHPVLTGIATFWRLYRRGAFR